MQMVLQSMSSESDAELMCDVQDWHSRRVAGQGDQGVNSVSWKASHLDRRRWRSSISGQLASQHPSGPCHDEARSGVATPHRAVALKHTGCATTTRGAAMCCDVVQQRGSIASTVSPTSATGLIPLLCRLAAFVDWRAVVEEMRTILQKCHIPSQGLLLHT